MLGLGGRCILLGYRASIPSKSYDVAYIAVI